MRIILINPPLDKVISDPRTRQVARHLFFNSPPLGIAYIAAVMEDAGAEAGIIDSAAEGKNTGETIREVCDFQPDIIGITSTTPFFFSAVYLAQGMKKIFPAIPVVIGGAHISANPEHVLGFDCFDVGVLGEGEETMRELVPAILSRRSYDDIGGLCYRRQGKNHRTPPRPLISDLDALPFPARHLLKLNLYVPQPNDEYRLPKTSMITSRGCPYGCIFCDKHVFGNTYRFQSPARIVQEVNFLHKRYGIKDIAFVDSCFGASRSRLEEILREFRDHPLPVSWTCSLRCNILEEQILAKMKAAGCWRVRLGLESGSERILEFIRKGITLEQARRAAVWADRAGLRPKAFFMIGHLTDTRETIEETIRFACSLPLHDITVQINTPMYGTPQYALAGNYGRIEYNSLSEMSYFQPVYAPAGMEKEELDYLFRKFYRSFYLRPITVWRHLRSIKSPRDLLKYFRAAKLVWQLMNPFGKKDDSAARHP